MFHYLESLKDHYKDLSIANVTDKQEVVEKSKTFYNKIKRNPNIVLVKDNLITNEKLLAETFNYYFVSVVANLGVNNNSVKSGVSNYDNYSSIISIKQHITSKNKVFWCRKVTKEEISSAIKTLNRKKTTLSNDIPTKIIQ